MSDETREGRRATPADFKVQTYEFEIESPVGEVWIVEMRALSQTDLLEVGRKMPPFPQAQVTDYKTNEDGKVEPIRNFNDPAYERAIQDWRRLQMRLTVLQSWQVEWMVETEEEKLACLDGLAGWASSGLWQIVNMLISSSSEAIKYRPFRGN